MVIKLFNPKKSLAHFSDIKPIRNFNIDPEVESERLIAFKYVTKEIRRKKLLGEVAEAGVMFGYFARYISEAFPDKELHLFDTFSGFDKDELQHDHNSGLLTNAYNYDMFDNNSVDKVKSSIPDAIYHIGKFEDTMNEAKDLTFAFTSIDMDLYQPTLQALDFFYPRMVDNGYIFVHDYNHPEDFHGARAAVHDFETFNSLNLKMIPLPDYSGTMAIIK
jgi:O-methyltransferase